MSAPVVVVGDALLDVDVVGRADRLSPEAPVPVIHDARERRRPGGAALAALLAATGAGAHRPVVLIAPIATDADADVIRALLSDRVRLIALPWTGATPVKTRLQVGGHAVARVDRGGGADAEIGALPAVAHEVLEAAAAVLVADYGQGVTCATHVRHALTDIAGQVPMVWDPHPRGGVPVPGVRVATPNAAEAAFLAGGSGHDLRAVTRHAEALLLAWRAAGIAVTLGERGALLAQGHGAPLVLSAPPVVATDTCGAGDRFASALTVALADGALPSEAVAVAVTAAARFVAAGGAARLETEPGGAARLDTGPEAVSSREDAVALAARIRAAGGTVVATGGCFDVLHAGHVSTLETARGLGDCLIVCLNSDTSVRRLKGPQRPLQSAADRVRVLAALGCVDAVLVFEDDTPTDALRTICPHVWVKGGDYAGSTLPEAAALAEWDGQAVAVPYLPGRSTSRLVAGIGKL